MNVVEVSNLDDVRQIKNPRCPKTSNEGDIGFWNLIYKPHLINLPPSDAKTKMK